MLDLGWVDGKRRRRALYGKTQPAAIKRLNAAKRELERTGTLPTTNPTLETWLRRWLDTIAVGEVQESTLESTYRPKIERVIATLGRRRLDKLQPGDLRALYAQMASEGAARSTVVQTHSILKRALKVAVREGVLTRNVAGTESMDAPKVGKAAVETQPIAPEDVLKLLVAIRGDRLESRWLAALTLGPRQGEALGLGWDDIDLDNGMLRIERGLRRVKGVGLRFVDVKSAKSHRWLPVPPWLLESLRRRHEAWLAEPRDAYNPADYGPLAPAGLVWGQPNGKPRDGKQDWSQWKALLEAAGVSHVGTHAARHTVATMLSAKGAPVKVAQEILGHSQSSLTLNVYTHAGVEAMRPWLTVLDEAFRELPAVEAG